MIDSAASKVTVADAGDDAGYGYRVVTVEDAVERAVSGEWDVPEFQREFVWQPSQVCGLADSLWRNYPIGALLLWRGAEYNHAPGRPQWWIADGQQRLTSLCILCGREPAWLRRKPAESRTRLVQRYDPCFDAGSDAPARFVAARAAARPHDLRLVPTSSLMTIDPCGEHGRTELERLGEQLKACGCYPELDAAELCRRLSRVSMIRRRELIATLVQHEREDVLEIFERLNSRGMRFRRLLLKLVLEEIPAAIRGLRGPPTR
ncbi:MAG: DUF262 domain-containing protein [Bryobacteraceae bacterium]